MLPQMFAQPGCVNTTEIDIKKACKVNNPFTVIKVGHFIPYKAIHLIVSPLAALQTL